MFSLIVVIIAIALVAALALASIYYGGTAFNRSKDEVIVASAVNVGNQVKGAFELYRTDHDNTLPTGTVDEIKNIMQDKKYLAEWPSSEKSNGTTVEWGIETDYATISNLSADQCLALNKKLGIDYVPSCSATGFEGKNYCCTTPP